MTTHKFLTDDEMESLLISAKHALSLCINTQGKPFLVIVDGEQNSIPTIGKLRHFLRGCLIQPGIEPFRNMNGGVTLDLDA